MMNHASKPSNLADRILAIEVFSELCASTAPKELGKRLTEQLRELTGARTIFLVSHTTEPKTNPLLYACPTRRSNMFANDELKKFCPHHFPGNLPCLRRDFPVAHPLRQVLEREMVESVLRIPLNAGGELIGSILLLDLPEIERIDETVEILSHLAPTIALALKNTLDYERIEMQSRELERQAQDLERRVAERTADLANANEALADEKERLSVTLRSIADGVITTDGSARVLVMNKIAEQFTGWDQAEALGKPIAEVFQPVSELSGTPCPDLVGEVLAKGTIEEQENHVLLRGRNGVERFIAESVAPIRDRDSVTIGTVIVFRDKTEKQRMLDALQRADKLDALGVLAGGIAHDFNNMLAGIFGYIDLARDSCHDDPETLDSLNQAMKVFERAKGLTQQLLTFSKGGTPIRKTGEIGPTIRESAAFALSGSNIVCEYQIPVGLWVVDFDRNQIGQVIDNLVINARQAMPTGGKIVIAAANVTIAAGQKTDLKTGRYVRIRITDRGIGIPPAHLKRIFDPFFTTKQKGNGLGLATCYGIVLRHQGGIEVESILGQGATFSVFLPASTSTAIPEATRGVVSHSGSGAILVMDDETFIRDILGRMLREMGYQVLAARDGKEALALFAAAQARGESVTAAIFDLTVPGGMGGREALAGLRELHSDLPVFASSGYSEDPVIADPLRFGFTASIRKPYTRDDLVAMMNRCLPAKK